MRFAGSRGTCGIDADPAAIRAHPADLALSSSLEVGACYQVVMESVQGMRTERLEIRPVIESDRRRYVDLFMDPDFMVFSATGSLDSDAANTRFDHMMTFSRKVPFGKQAIIEIPTASVIGYVGVDEFGFRGECRLEFGYRLVKEARGLGYATEASHALLELAGREWQGELFAFVDPENGASRNVLMKTGFELVDRIVVKGGTADLYSRSI